MAHAATRFVPCWLAMILLLLAEPAAGEHGSPGDLRNAATWYKRAIEQLNRLPQADFNRLVDYDPRTNPTITPELRATLDKVQPLLTDFRRGTRQHYSDFNLAYEQGLDMLLPDLGGLRRVAMIANADALARLQGGDSRGAAERLSQLYRFSDHFADDRVVISSLVGSAVFDLAEQAVQFGIDHAAFDALDHAVLFTAIDELASHNDPFNYIGGLATDHDMLVNWLEQVRAEEPGLRWQEMQMMFGEDVHSLDGVELSDELFDSWIEAHDGFMDDVVAIFMIDDPDEARTAMAELERAMLDSEAHILAAHLSPSYSHILERSLDGRAKIRHRHAMLRELVEGEVDQETIANAAAWYLRGIGVLHDLEPDYLQAIRAFAFDADEPLDDPIKAALLSSQHIITVFREGSEKRRCDFNFGLSYRPMFMPPYAVGMRDAFRLLRADAARQLENGETDIFVDRISMMLRVVGHLAGDHQYLSAMIAHRALLDAAELIEHALADDSLSGEQRAVMSAALNRVDRADPFGYLGAQRMWRERLIRRIEVVFMRERYQPREQDALQADADPPDDDERESEEALVQRVERADDATLFSLLALDESVRRMRESSASPTRDPPPRQEERNNDADAEPPNDDDEAPPDRSPQWTLRDVLHLERLPLIHDAASRLRSVSEHDWVVQLLRASTLRISDLSSLRASARGDLRRVSSLLATEAIESPALAGDVREE